MVGGNELRRGDATQCATRALPLPILLCGIALPTALLLTTACPDGATRLAYQIESDVTAFERASATRTTLLRQPIRRWGNGCDEVYLLQVDKVGGPVIWCKDATSSVITDSRSASFNARFTGLGDVDRREAKR